MSKPIVTFEDFIKRILKVILWVVLLVLLIGVPVYYVLDVVTHFNLFALATAKPLDLVSLQDLLSTEPYKTLFALIVFPGFSFVAIYGTIFMGWVERKFTAKIQLRTGPMYAGKVEGILQNVADFFKLFFKEMIIRDGVD